MNNQLYPFKHILALVRESLNQAAMLELEKPCVTGIVLSPLVVNQIKIAQHCMKSISAEKIFSISYYMSLHNLEKLIVIFKLPKIATNFSSPVDLTLLCEKLHVIYDESATYFVMLMEKPFYEIYESISDEPNSK